MAQARTAREAYFPETLDSVKKDWTAIHGSLPVPTFFSSYDYLKIWYGSFAKEERVRIFRAMDGGVTAGFLPLVHQRKKSVKILTSLTNNHSFYSIPLIKPGYEERFPDLIVKELLRHCDSWDMIRYSFAYSFTQSWNIFREEVLKEHQVPAENVVEPTYSVLMKQSFNDYFEKDLSSKTRSTIRNRMKKIEQAGGSRYLHVTGVEAAARFSDFERIEDSGWKGRGGSSIARVSADYRTYYRQLVNHLADCGAMHLNFLEFNGELIAGQFGYVEGDTFHSFKIAYDETYNAFSPAVLLFIAMVKNLYANYPAVKRLHMFPWDFGYKHRFCNEEQSYRETILFSPTLRGKGVQSWFALRNKLRQIPALKPLAQRYTN